MHKVIAFSLVWDNVYEVEFSSLCKRNCGNVRTVLNKTGYSTKNISLLRPRPLTGKVQSPSQPRVDFVTGDVGKETLGLASLFVSPGNLCVWECRQAASHLQSLENQQSQ